MVTPLLLFAVLLAARPLAASGGSVEVEVADAVPEDADAIRERSERFLTRLEERFAGGGPPVSARIHVFASHEQKGLETGDVTALSLTGDDTAQIVLCGDRSRHDGRAEALVFLRARFGEPALPMMADGASRALADEDCVLDYRATAAWVHAAGETTRLSDLVDPVRYGMRSGLVQAPLAAVLAEVLLELGSDAFTRAWNRGEIDLALVEPAFHARLDAFTASHRHWMVERRRRRHARATTAPLRGFCFSHEGYRIRDGYISEMANRSLERARSLGATAVSITPFGYYRDPHDPEIRWRRRTEGDRQGYETDESLLVAGDHARRLGFAVMMKPHLWGHGWCGDLEMKSDDDRRRWFESYGEFLVHYALLAERGEYDWLSIGCELVKMTRGRDAEWRSLAARARALFSGGLTYASNWGDEMERIGFADALDAVGVDCYFSLATKEDPTDAELRSGAIDVIRRIAGLRGRYRRPILLTEIGFPVRERSWLDPHRSRGGEAASPRDQARCYRAFFDAFAAEASIDGFFVWKWPTFDRWHDARRVDFWPASDDALEVLRGAFSER